MTQKITALRREEVQQFLREHEHEDEKTLVLRHSRILGMPSSWIAEQLEGRRRAKDKLPTLYHTDSIVYPPAVALEQSSSEATAAFKVEVLTSVFRKRAQLNGIDLTGGLGIDSFFLSRACDQLDYVEPNEYLLEVARHNHGVLGSKNIHYHHSDAEAYMKSILQPFDFVYVDPSRRNSVRRVVRLGDAEPGIAHLLPLIFDKASTLLVKASPMLDLQQGMNELKCVKKIFVVSVNNECKELLFLCGKNVPSEPEIECVNLISGVSPAKFTFMLSTEKNAVAHFSEPLSYLYEPNASILKAGAFKLIGLQFGLFKLHLHTHLYTSESLVSGFPGRVFRIEDRHPDLRKIKNDLPDRKANVMTRNYPLSTEQIKKKLKIRDGGERYLIGFTAPAAKFLVLAKRIS